MKPRQCAIMGYAPAGMHFNSISMHHMLDMFHVCYEVTSVNTAEPKSAMHNSNQWNTEKSVDCGLVVEQRVVEAAEQSGLEKKRRKTKEKQQYHCTSPPSPNTPTGTPYSAITKPLTPHPHQSMKPGYRTDSTSTPTRSWLRSNLRVTPPWRTATFQKSDDWSTMEQSPNFSKPPPLAAFKKRLIFLVKLDISVEYRLYRTHGWTFLAPLFIKMKIKMISWSRISHH